MIKSTKGLVTKWEVNLVGVCWIICKQERLQDYVYSFFCFMRFWSKAWWAHIIATASLSPFLIVPFICFLSFNISKSNEIDRFLIILRFLNVSSLLNSLGIMEKWQPWYFVISYVTFENHVCKKVSGNCNKTQINY